MLCKQLQRVNQNCYHILLIISKDNIQRDPELFHAVAKARLYFGLEYCLIQSIQRRPIAFFL